MNNFLVSLITMDHINFERDIRLVDSLGVDGLHIDIMDGNFVPRYGIYPEIIERLSTISSLPLDLHMMVKDVEFGIDQFKGASNIEYIHFHILIIFETLTEVRISLFQTDVSNINKLRKWVYP